MISCPKRNNAASLLKEYIALVVLLRTYHEEMLFSDSTSRLYRKVRYFAIVACILRFPVAGMTQPTAGVNISSSSFIAPTNSTHTVSHRLLFEIFTLLIISRDRNVEDIHKQQINQRFIVKSIN